MTLAYDMPPGLPVQFELMSVNDVHRYTLICSANWDRGSIVTSLTSHSTPCAMSTLQSKAVQPMILTPGWQARMEEFVAAGLYPIASVTVGLAGWPYGPQWKNEQDYLDSLGQDQRG